MNRSAIFLSALLVLLFTNIGDVHGHYCLDGQEPAVSFHFESLDGHPEHDGDLAHNDYENELELNPTIGKLKLLDHDFLAPLNSDFSYLLSLKDYFISKTSLSFIENETFILNPPLRAPPLHV